MIWLWTERLRNSIDGATAIRQGRANELSPSMAKPVAWGPPIEPLSLYQLSAELLTMLYAESCEHEINQQQLVNMWKRYVLRDSQLPLWMRLADKVERSEGRQLVKAIVPLGIRYLIAPTIPVRIRLQGALEYFDQDEDTTVLVVRNMRQLLIRDIVWHTGRLLRKQLNS